MADDADLLAALRIAHEHGDTESAIKIAAALSARPVDKNIPGGNQDMAATPPQPGMTGKQIVGNIIAAPIETAAQIGSAAVAGPLSGYAGLLAAGLKGAAGLVGANKFADSIDPAGVVTGTQRAMTYEPLTPGGQGLSHVVGYIPGKMAEGADWAGRRTAEASGSPLLGAAVNTGLQGVGMALGAKLPVIADAVRNAPGVSGAVNFASDLLPGGGQRAANRITRQYAGGDDPLTADLKTRYAADTLQAHLDAQAALDRAGAGNSLASKYGLHPTTAQLADNPGLAVMDRTLRTLPGSQSVLADADAVNNAAKRNVVDQVAGTPERIAALTKLRDDAARARYEAATTHPDNYVQPPGPEIPSFDDALQGPAQTTNGKHAGITAGLNDVGTDLQSLLQRPAMRDAMADAHVQAGNRGTAIDERNLVQQLHFAKLSLDGKIGAASRSGDSTTLGGLMDTKRTLVDVLDRLSPDYALARQEFAANSRPINALEVGQALRDKYSSALSAMSGEGGTPSMFTNALTRDGDALAARATGFGGATLENTLAPGHLQALNDVADQLAREHYAQNAGRSVGSNTGQNLANRRAIEGVGSLDQISDDLGPAGRVVGMLDHPGIAIPSAIAGGIGRRAAQAHLADIAVDPASAIAALRSRPFSFNDTMGPSIMNPAASGLTTVGNEQLEGHADGGEIHKTTFFEKLQQAYHELTGDQDPPPPPPPSKAPLGTGMAQQAGKNLGANFANIDDAVAAQDH